MTLAERLETLLQRHWWAPEPTLLARALWPLSRLYMLLAAAQRRRLVRRAPKTLPVPVLVVGNLVVGGAGKTPTVLALVQALQAAGRRPGVLSRGHGRADRTVRAVTAGSSAHEVGDEPLLIQRRSGVPVWVGRDRMAAARALRRAHPEIDLLVSDDGLQHLALPRAAELVVFDERGAGNGLMLPAGPLREALSSQPATGARRWLLYTSGRTSTALPGTLAQRRLGLAWPLQAWWAGDASAAVPLLALRGKALVAAAGLAAPQKFFAMLRDEQLDITALPLPDHFDYHELPWPDSTGDVITTEKDAVKLQPGRVGTVRVWVVPLDLQLPAELIHELLSALPVLRSPALRG